MQGLHALIEFGEMQALPFSKSKSICACCLDRFMLSPAMQGWGVVLFVAWLQMLAQQTAYLRQADKPASHQAQRQVLCSCFFSQALSYIS